MATKSKSTAKPKIRSTARKANARKASALNTGRKGSHVTKTGAIIGLLKRPKGAGIAQLQKVTGWQPHSVRAALTGLRKKGFEVQRTKDAKGVTIYRVA